MSFDLAKALALYNNGDLDAVEKIIKKKHVNPSPQQVFGDDFFNEINNESKPTNTIVSSSVPVVTEQTVNPISYEEETIVEIETPKKEMQTNDLIEYIGEYGEYNGEKILSKDLPKEIEASMLKWLKIEDDLYQLKQIKQELDKQKKPLEIKIKEFMSTWEIQEIGPTDNVGLQYKTKENKQGYSKKLIEHTLSKIFPEDQYEKIMEIMESERQVTEKTSIKLKKPRKNGKDAYKALMKK